MKYLLSTLACVLLNFGSVVAEESEFIQDTVTSKATTSAKSELTQAQAESEDAQREAAAAKREASAAKVRLSNQQLAEKPIDRSKRTQANPSSYRSTGDRYNTGRAWSRSDSRGYWYGRRGSDTPTTGYTGK